MSLFFFAFPQHKRTLTFCFFPTAHIAIIASSPLLRSLTVNRRLLTLRRVSCSDTWVIPRWVRTLGGYTRLRQRARWVTGSPTPSPTAPENHKHVSTMQSALNIRNTAVIRSRTWTIALRLVILAVNSMGAFSANSVITVRCEKVMFSQVFVCPQVHGRRGGDCTTPLVGRHPPHRQPLQRTVRILLECILV